MAEPVPAATTKKANNQPHGNNAVNAPIQKLRLSGDHIRARPIHGMTRADKRALNRALH